jgi:hypothetical protein
MYRPPALFAKDITVPTDYLHEAVAATLLAHVRSARRSMKGTTPAMLAEEERAARWFVEGLYRSYCCIPPVWMALPATTAAYSSGARGRPPFGYRIVMRVREAAQALGWIKVLPGMEGEPGRMTRIKPSGRLLAWFKALGVQWQLLPLLPRELLIEVRDNSTPPILHGLSLPAFDKPLAEDRLLRINEHLAQQCIYLDCPDDSLLGIGGRQTAAATGNSTGQAVLADSPPLSFGRVQLHRIFSRGRLDMGGRFYGGWWQSIPSEFRRNVVINDWPTVECDYSGMALRCLYGLEGLDMGDSDPYDIGIAYTGSDGPRRKLVKRYVNAILNDEKGTFRLGRKELGLIGLSHRQLHDRVARRHAKISRHFGTGIGLHLQYVDSQIAERVMLHFVELGETCLPIHDSFIVRAGLQGELVTAMGQAFLEVIGRPGKVNVDVENPGERIWRPSPDLRPQQGLTAVDKAMDVARQHLGRFSISTGYFASYQESVRANPDLDQAVLWDERADWQDHLRRGLSTRPRRSKRPSEPCA